MTFQVQLYEQHTKEPAHKVLLGGQAQFGSCMVQIRDDDKTPGLFCWDNERIEVPESCGSVNLTVLRTMGLSGEVRIKRSYLATTLLLSPNPSSDPNPSPNPHPVSR